MMYGLYENYQELAEAIILQAVRDYRNCVSHKAQKDIEKFFCSKWFATLTTLDGKRLIKRLRKERTKCNE